MNEFIIRAMIIPNPDNGAFNMDPSSHFGHWRKPVAATAPLKIGHRETGWYRVVEVVFHSREDAARTLGGAIWSDDQMTEDEATREGLALLAELGY